MLSQGSDRYFLCVITSGISLSGLIRWLCAVLLLLFAAAAAVGPVLHYSEIMRVVYACSVFVLVLLTYSLFGCSCSGWCTVSPHFVGQAVIYSESCAGFVCVAICVLLYLSGVSM